MKKDSVEVGFRPEVREAIAQFKAAKQAEAEAKALKAQAEEVLREALGEAQEASVGGVVVVKVVNGSNRHANLKVLADAFPEAYKASLVVTDYDYLKVL
jgi:hypothetical protein